MSDNLKLLTEWSPWQYSKEMIEESKQTHDGKIIMKGVLQKSEGSETFRRRKARNQSEAVERFLKHFLASHEDKTC